MQSKYTKITLSIILIGLILTQAFFSFLLDIVRVDAREVAVVTNRGEVSQVLGAGWHFKLPYFTSHSATYDISTQNLSVKSSAASKDQQVVNMQVNLQYLLQPDKIKEIYLTIGGSGNGGLNKDERILNLIQPIFQESIKTASAQYTATDLLAKREEVKQAVTDNIKERLSKYYINIVIVNIENIDFSDQFDQAIENKVVAQQKAIQAQFELEGEKNNLEKERVKSEALRVRGEALRQNPQILEEQKIQKWDGKLPQVQGQDGIIIDLKQ
jgi:regulator of protease activity HflC (stomatin/prohibitin superfamily)